MFKEIILLLTLCSGLKFSENDQNSQDLKKLVQKYKISQGDFSKFFKIVSKLSSDELGGVENSLKGSN